MIQNIIRKIRFATMSLATLLLLGTSGLAPLTQTAAADSLKSDACAGLSQVGGSCGAKGGSSINHLLADVANILSAIVGAAAVIMIIISAFKYITAAGDAQKIASAKSTLIYAIIGLIIVALAQTIVHFVLFKASKA